MTRSGRELRRPGGALPLLALLLAGPLSSIGFAQPIETDSLGVNVHIGPTDVIREAQELGVGWVRADLNWADVEGTASQYYWDQFETLVRDAESHGLKVYATIASTPSWASTGDRRGDGSRNDVPRAEAFSAFVAAAVTRYCGRVAAWGLWNEPEFPWFFEGTKEEWLDSVFIPGVDAIKAACPTNLAVGPDMYWDPGGWLEAAVQARGSSLGAVTWHRYSTTPPDDIRAQLVTLGLESVPLWLTETGYPAPISDPIQLDAQKSYVSTVLTQMESRSWWQRTFFYELADDPYNSTYGLALRVLPSDSTEYEHFQHKPAFDYIRGVAPARLAIVRVGDGTVTSDPPGIACGQSCATSFTRGETVTLTASPSSRFQGWGGACTGTGDCTVAMDGAKSVVATFDSSGSFYSVTPCRVFDTREASGPTAGAPLTCGTAQSFAVAGKCAVPSSAKAVSVNVTGTASTAQGNLRLYPTGSVTPLVSTLNYAAGVTRANNAVAALGTGGQVSVLCSPSGTTHVILDMTGYFE
jgi:hypothetical protein